MDLYRARRLLLRDLRKSKMTERFLDNRIDLHCGDCLDVLPMLAADSIDSCVTDPPYHLTSIVARFGANDAAPAKSNGATGVYSRASAGFMGQTWDGGDVAFRVETWRAVYRVLKPGAHLVAFGGTRTYHRMACAIEDAGFEIRDCAMWLYGSGFPKSHDVAKGIAKARVEDVEPVRVICRAIRAAMDARGLKSHELVQHFDDCHPRLIDHWAARDTDSQPAIPTWEQWLVLRYVLPSLDESLNAEVWRLNERKGKFSDCWNGATVLGEYDREAGGFGDHRFSVRDKKIRALSDSAREWSGWGTALKPACEPIVLARKPLGEPTVAANVLKWGTGAINIEGCRVATDETIEATRNIALGSSSGGIYGAATVPGIYAQHGNGRWPANVVHDGSAEVVAGFPDTGVSSGGLGAASQRTALAGHIYGEYAGDRLGQNAGGLGDSGSAARFFYTAKADDHDRIGSKHPTVKPLDLMQYLIRLVTRKGGTVLDPFAGTGTTGEAAFREGMMAVLIEAEPAYQNDIRRRMKLAIAGPDERARESIKAKHKDKPRDDGPLFGGS